jgi:hypothetical protein
MLCFGLIGTWKQITRLALYVSVTQQTSTIYAWKDFFSQDIRTRKIFSYSEALTTNFPTHTHNAQGSTDTPVRQAIANLVAVR